MRRTHSRAWRVAVALVGVAGTPGIVDAGVLASDTVDVRIEVHEGYELANVAIALHPFAEESPHLVLRQGPYWDDVRSHFAGFDDDPAVRAIRMKGDDWVQSYYAVRNGGYRWRFDGAALVPDRPALFWRVDGFAPLRSAFEGFAERSDFRGFFRGHAGYYDEMVERYAALVDIPRMARWLEHHFPRTSIDRYVVVLSPLVYGSHNTRTVRSEGATEAYMFVAGPDLPVAERLPGYRAAANERVVFTEIDHNYVNPETDRVRDRVEALLGPELGRWNVGRGYGSAYATFNEYMTWSAYLLYAWDSYSPGMHDTVRSAVVRQMEERRGFPLFGAFHAVVEDVYRDRPEGTPFAELYPRVLARLETISLAAVSHR